MDDLANNNCYKLTDNELKEIQKDFDAVCSDDNFGKDTIKKYLDNHNYLMDPHTATCLKDFDEDKTTKTVIYSTAEWTKFSPTVCNALNNSNDKIADTDALKVINKKYNAKIPQMVQNIFDKPITHDLIIDKEDIQKEITKFIS
jgi:threonine synthase